MSFVDRKISISPHFVSLTMCTGDRNIVFILPNFQNNYALHLST